MTTTMPAPSIVLYPDEYLCEHCGHPVAKAAKERHEDTHREDRAA